jgi:hypothetical protein
MTDIKLLGASLLSDLMPGVKDITSAFSDMLAGGEGASEDLSEAVADMLTGILDKAIDLLPRLIDLGADMVVSVGTSIIERLPEMIPKIVTAIVGNIPKILDAGLKLFGALVKAIPPTAVALLKELPQLGTTILKYLLTLPGKVLSIGGDLVKGLWQGMTDKKGWVKEKIKGWVGDVTKFLKKLFGINSPSKVTAYMGEMLDEGLAVGIEGNASAPKKAMSDLTGDLVHDAGHVDGLTIDRQVTQSYTANAAATAAQSSTVLSKLDLIYKAILSGQVIMLDGKTLVGSTADRYDNELGQRRVLAERGAL